MSENKNQTKKMDKYLSDGTDSTGDDDRSDEGAMDAFVRFKLDLGNTEDDEDAAPQRRPELSDAEKAARREAAMRAAGRWKEPVERSKAELDNLFPRYPAAADDSRYSYSVPVDNHAEVAALLDKYGLAVVSGVLTAEECTKTVLDCLEDARSQASSPGGEPILLDDPSTWENQNWPRPRSKFLFGGPAFTQQAFANRTKPSLHKLFAHLYGDDRLWCSIDNWGVMRGTQGLDSRVDGIESDRPKWRYSLEPHWDCNPYRTVADRAAGQSQRFQALVALVDCPVEVGTFAAVPGSAAFLPAWCAERKAPTMRRDRSMRPSPNDPMCAYIQPIPLRAGEMVIFDFALLHANVPNECAQMRLIQYIRYLPASRLHRNMDKYSPHQVWNRYPEEEAKSAAADYLDQRQRRLCGLEEYPGLTLDGRRITSDGELLDDMSGDPLDVTSEPLA